MNKRRDNFLNPELIVYVYLSHLFFEKMDVVKPQIFPVTHLRERKKSKVGQ